MKVEVTTPDEYQGDLLGDINRRRGDHQALKRRTARPMLNAHVPLAEMFGYATAIRSLSKGRASYSMEPLTFAQVPNSVLETILEPPPRSPAART
jgi:elongation factor G